MPKKYIATYNEKEIPIQIEHLEGDQIKITSGEKDWIVDVHQAGPHHYSVIQEGKSYDLRFFRKEDEIQAFLHGEHVYFQLQDERSHARKARQQAAGGGTAIEGKAEIKAQMPGKVVMMKVKEGDDVEQGQGVVVVEAMKMENEIGAPKTGKVTAVKVAEGDSVETGTLMVVIE